ncbi:MAG: hypothetical protein LBU35_03355 [Holosporales bacterium]|jgi:hypothetical protein|nr:hypothetical protein [Holosporales bacterium]
MKNMLCTLAILFLSINDAFTAYDPRANAFNSFRSPEDEKPRLIFAGGQGLNYRCFSSCFDARTKSMNFNSFRGSAYDWMLALKYDLDVAEYKMNWGAKEALGKELLETIGGSHGLSPIDPRDGQAQINKMNNFMDMISLQASIALDHVARQKRTTEFCKAALASNSTTAAVARNPRAIEPFVRARTPRVDNIIITQAQAARVDDSRFLVQPFTPRYNANNVHEFIELGRVIANPIHNKNIYEAAWNKFNDITPAIELSLGANPTVAQARQARLQTARDSYVEATKDYLSQNFQFIGNSRLEQTAKSYFEKIYDKAERLVGRPADPALRYPGYSGVNLKLRDCNGGDIYGNGNVCSFNSRLDLIRQEQGNQDFIAAGGMLSLAELRGWNTTSLGQQWISQHQYYDRSQTHYVPYKKFALSGNLISSEQTIDTFYSSQEAVNLMPTNDLSSRSRAFVSYRVFLANMNEQMQHNRFIQRRRIAIIPQDNSLATNPIPCVAPQYIRDHIEWRVDQWGNTIPGSEPTRISGDTLTPLHLLIGYDPSVREQEAFEQKMTAYDTLYASMGMNSAYFNNSDSWLAWEHKNLWNETTIIPSERGSLRMPLLIARILNPFAPIVGTAGANNHSKLVLQY